MTQQYRVEIDKGYLEYIPKAINNNGLQFLSDVIDKVPNYIPQDTGSLVSSHNILKNDKELSIALYYGSVFDDRVNAIAITQHEKVLNHFGTPGGSMRQEISGDIPGAKYILGEMFVGKTVESKRDYQKGYREKLKAGRLSYYKTEFLKNAVEEVIKKNLKDNYGKRIEIPKKESRIIKK